MAFFTDTRSCLTIVTLGLCVLACCADEEKELPTCTAAGGYSLQPLPHRPLAGTHVMSYEPIPNSAFGSRFQFRGADNEVLILSTSLFVESPFVSWQQYEIEIVEAGSGCLFGGSHITIVDVATGAVLLIFGSGDNSPVAKTTDVVIDRCVHEAHGGVEETVLMDFSVSGGPDRLAPGSSVEQGRYHYYAFGALKDCGAAGMILAEWARQ